MKKISILGSTGSAVAAHSNVRLLEEQIREFSPEFAVCFDEEAAKALKTAVSDCPVRIGAGMEGLCEAASFAGADMVLNSVVGMIGLRPTLEAIRAGKHLCGRSDQYKRRSDEQPGRSGKQRHGAGGAAE